MTQELPAAAMEALARGHKIEAIKIVRQEWSIDLKAAKDAVDAHVAARPELASQLRDAGQGTKRVLLLILVLVGVGILLVILFRRS
jgi:hypothetical protein